MFLSAIILKLPMIPNGKHLRNFILKSLRIRLKMYGYVNLEKILTEEMA